MCQHKGKKMSSHLKLRCGITAHGIAQASTSLGGFQIQKEQGVARVGACAQSRLPLLALNCLKNSLC